MSQMIAVPANVLNEEEDFFNFHNQNHGVYDSLVALARMTKAAGVERYGIRDLLSVCRWQAALRGKHFKVRNSFTPYYARLIEAQEEDLEGFFRMATANCDADLILTEALMSPVASFTSSFEAAASIFLGKPLRNNRSSLFALK